MFECKTHLGGETAGAEVRSTGVGVVVTRGIATVLLKVVSRLITGAGYILLIPPDPKGALVVTEVLRRKRIEYCGILTSSTGWKCLTKLWLTVLNSLHKTTKIEGIKSPFISRFHIKKKHPGMQFSIVNDI